MSINWSVSSEWRPTLTARESWPHAVWALNNSRTFSTLTLTWMVWLLGYLMNSNPRVVIVAKSQADESRAQPSERTLVPRFTAMLCCLLLSALVYRDPMSNARVVSAECVRCELRDRVRASRDNLLTRHLFVEHAARAIISLP